MKLHKEDEVKILRGKDAGKTGKIEKVFEKEMKVLVPGINQYKRHVKSRVQGQQSEIVTITKPLSVSRVALVCPKCKQTTRVGFSIKNNTKIRVCRKCKAELGKVN